MNQSRSHKAFFDYRPLTQLPKTPGLYPGRLLRAGEKHHSLVHLFVYFLLAFFLTNCANPIAPTGGPRDEQPPQLDTLTSTRNRQVRFEKQDIVLGFNEWVQLKDAFNQVVVSPPLEFRPTIERKKKTIQFKFDEREALRDSATYVINFGDAIQDLTEGNIAPIVFVFSTGDYIDSLSVEGTIIDAYTAEPVEDVLFMLYENLADSVFRTERPFYFSKTDENGRFKVENIKEGAFKAAALIDNNLNYRFDSDAEKVAFLDTALLITGSKPAKVDSLAAPVDSINIDTTLQVDTLSENRRPPITAGLNTRPTPKPLVLRLFEEEKTLFLSDDDTETYGLVKLAFNREPYDAVITYDSIGQYSYIEQEKDTVYLWYAMETDAGFQVYVKRDTLIDTIEVENGLKEAFYSEATLEPTLKMSDRLPVIPPGADFELPFKYPLFSIEEGQATLYEDSLKTVINGEYRIDSGKKRVLKVKAPYKEGLRYELEMPPGSLLDIFGLQNVDTVRHAWIMGEEKEFGSLTLRVTDLRPDTAYVIRVLAKNDELLETFTAKDSTSFQTHLKYLSPGTYSIEIIEDLDANGRWTSGDYDLQRQPERVQKAILEEVRANWEVDAEVGFGDFRPPVAKSQSEGPAPGSSGRTSQPPGGRRQ